MRLIDADAMEKRRIDYIVDGYAESVNDMTEWGMALIEAPTIGGWVPVTERLPEKYAQYLVCDEDGECFVYWLEDAYWARRDIEQEHIVAWMPLPPAYKEDM